MPSRIITDASGDRWDVSEAGHDSRPPAPADSQDRQRSQRQLVFRHQSGHHFTLPAAQPLDAMTSDELRALAEQGRNRAGEDPDVEESSLDPEGYTTN
jgi:hypothetical protein